MYVAPNSRTPGLKARTKALREQAEQVKAARRRTERQVAARLIAGK